MHLLPNLQREIKYFQDDTFERIHTGLGLLANLNETGTEGLKRMDI